MSVSTMWGRYWNSVSASHSAGFCQSVWLPGSILNFRIGSVSSIGGLIAATLFADTVSDSLIFFSNSSGASGISRQNSGISRQKSLISLVSRDISNFLAPHPFMWKTPAPPEKIRTKKFRFGFLFRAWWKQKTKIEATSETSVFLQESGFWGFWV